MITRVRPARSEELAYLQAKLREEQPLWEQVNLFESKVLVAEYQGRIVGFGAARLVFQIEPILLFQEFKENAPPFAHRRATLSLMRALDQWIHSPDNVTGVRTFFCFIVDRVMRKLAAHYGMVRVFTGGKFFREL